MKKKYNLNKKETFVGFLFCLPSILGMFVFFIIPFSTTIYISFTENMGSSNFVGLTNYINVLNSAAFKLAAVNTLRFNLIAVIAIIIISLFIALLLFRKLKGYDFFRTAFIFPLVLPVVSVVLFFRIIFSDFGVINNVLSFFNISPVDWINSENSFIMLLVLYLWKNVGYNIILFLAALNSIPKIYYEASDLDGANKFRQFYLITFPLIVPYTFFIIIISIINSFKSFREAFILFGSHPHQSIYMIQHFMNNNFQNLNYVRLSVGAILIFIVIFMLVLILFKIRNKIGDIEL